MKNKKLAKGIALLLVGALTFTAMPVSAATVSENDAVPTTEVTETDIPVETETTTVEDEVTSKSDEIQIVTSAVHSTVKKYCTPVTVSGNTYYLHNGNLLGFEGSANNGGIADLTQIGDTINGIGGELIVDNYTYGPFYPFSGDCGITKIIIPKTVKVIHEYAFGENSILTDVSFEENSALEVIEKRAFSNNASLTEIDLSGTKLISIGEDAFESCDKLATVKLPETLKRLDDGVFSSCGQLQTVEMNENSTIAAIPDSAFYYCGKLKTITLPDSITVIGNSAFHGCGSLSSVPVDPENSQLTTIGEDAFRDCVSLKEIKLPDCVESIGTRAFWSYYGNTALTSFTVPKSCVSIGQDAFGGCRALKELIIPQDAQLKTIDYGAFAGCKGLTNLTFPQSVTSIGEYAFNNINSTQTPAIIQFDNPDVTLQSNAFADLDYLTFMSEEGGAVQTYADETCPKIKFNRFSDSISVNALPAKTEYLYGETFSADGIDVKAVFTSDPEKVPTSVDETECSFKGYNKDKVGTQNITVTYGGQKASFDVKVYYDMSKARVDYISNQAYTGKKVEPEVTVTGKETGKKLTKGVDYEVTYSNCEKPGTATATITGIGQYKGTTTSNYTIDKLYISNCEVTVGDVVFGGSNTQNPSISVAYDGVELDKANYKVTYPTDVQGAGTYSVKLEGKDIIGGYDWYDYQVLPADMKSVKLKAIPDVTYNGSEQTPQIELYLGDYRLTDDDYSVSFSNNINPGTATVIIRGENNFKGTITANFNIVNKTQGNSVIVESSVTTEIGTVAQDTEKKAIVKVTGNEEGNLTVTYTGTTNKKASSVTIPDTVTVSGKEYKVTAVEDKAFKANKNLKKITVGGNVTSIGKDAFSGCTKLKTVTIGKNVTKIDANAFKGCKNLKTIVIKTNNLTSKSVSKKAFKGISAKTTIKVTKKMLKTYKKLFKSKGLSSKVKVKGI